MALNRWPDLKGVHVVVVDDNDDSCRLLEQALNDCGALVTVFSSAEAALEAMTEYLPTLIICDLSMPGITGLDVVRAVRETDRKTKVLLLTLHDSQELIRNAFLLGVNGYLLKTEAESELVRAIRIVLGDGIYLSPKLDPNFVKGLVAGIAGSPSN